MNAIRQLAAIATFLLVWLSAAPVPADEPTPTPTATPAPRTTPTPTAAADEVGGGEERTLGQVAGGITLDSRRTPLAEGGGVVISDGNLQEYASKGALTTAKPGQPAPTGTGAEADADAGEDMSDEQKREYWRSRYIEQKQLIAELEAEIEELDAEIPALWNKFYAWDDPAYRDGVIKPKLDEALKRREQLEHTLQEKRAELPTILEEARRDGALPGWFRDLT